MIVPMIATGAFGARRYPEVLPRLILCVIAAAGIALLLAPTPSIPQEGLNHLWVNWTFPYMIVPAVVIGGVMAVVTAKARP
jgi:peptidoglycan/LPS O-acetylase OafA/YrhL